jgi:hypothetical protein
MRSLSPQWGLSDGEKKAKGAPYLWPTRKEKRKRTQFREKAGQNLATRQAAQVALGHRTIEMNTKIGAKE